MTDSTPAPQEENNQPLDLGALQSLNFGPNWATSSEAPKPTASREYRDRGDSFGDRPQSGGGRRPDRRGFGGGERREFRPRGEQGGNAGGGFGGRRPEGNRFGGGERREFRGDRNERGPRRDAGDAARRTPGFDPTTQEFRRFHPRQEPVADIGFFPEEKMFSVLIKAIKASMRTYELFEIAHLILEKPERFVIGVRALDEKNTDKTHGKADKKFVYQSVPDGIPFMTESDAVAHVLHSHLEKFFTKEIVEIDPPKGNFQMVSKCGFTGEILGPPNYHGYQQTLREHHAAHLPHMSFDYFTGNIKSVREPEQIANWLEKMKQTVRYNLVNAKDGEPAQFESLESAKAFLLANRKEQVVRPLTSIRFSAKLIEKMPGGPLRSAIESDLAYQRRFPLGTANFLRSYLRNAGFVFSKGGSKGYTYVCAVKRKYRTPQTVFADAIQRVFDFIEKNQRINIAQLPIKYLGLTAETPAPAAQPVEEKPAETAPVAEATSPTTPTEENTSEAATEPTTEPAPEVAPEAAPEPVAEVAPEATPEAPAPAPEKISEKPKSQPKPQVIVDVNNPAVRDLLNTVRWLVSEGYVVEYSEGKLFALPVLTEAQLKAAAKKAKNENGTGDEDEEEIIPPAE